MHLRASAGVTYIRLIAGWLYLVAVLDWHNRNGVSWTLSNSLALPFVLRRAQAALAQANPLIWNSDQGSHFTSPQCTDLLRSADERISMGGGGRARDNIFTERLRRTVKYEEVYLDEYANPREARQGLTRCAEFCNHQRPHKALDHRTPAAAYVGAVASLNWLPDGCWRCGQRPTAPLLTSPQPLRRRSIRVSQFRRKARRSLTKPVFES